MSVAFWHTVDMTECVMVATFDAAMKHLPPDGPGVSPAERKFGSYEDASKAARERWPDAVELDPVSYDDYF